MAAEEFCGHYYFSIAPFPGLCLPRPELSCTEYPTHTALYFLNHEVSVRRTVFKPAGYRFSPVKLMIVTTKYC